MLHLTRFPSNLLLQLPLAPIPRSVHFPLQGEGSACARPLFERVLEPRPSVYRLCQTVTYELASPQSVTTSLRLPISDPEAKHYYHELHSKPVLVTRTGTDAGSRPLALRHTSGGWSVGPSETTP